MRETSIRLYRRLFSFSKAYRFLPSASSSSQSHRHRRRHRLCNLPMVSASHVRETLTCFPDQSQSGLCCRTVNSALSRTKSPGSDTTLHTIREQSLRRRIHWMRRLKLALGEKRETHNSAITHLRSSVVAVISYQFSFQVCSRK